MATRFKSVIALLAAAMVVATAACEGDLASDIEATIAAGIAATLVGAEIEKEVAAHHFNRGTTYGKLGEYAKAIQVDLNYALAYGNRSYSYNVLGQHQRTILDAEKAIQLNPNLVMAFATLTRPWL